MTDSVDSIIDAKVKIGVAKEIAVFKQRIPYLRACISTKEAMEVTNYSDSATFLKKFTTDPEVIQLGLFKKEANGYHWLNPEWSQWYHDVYTRRGN